MKAQIVSFHCVLRNKLGQIVSSSFNQDVINQLEEGTNRLQALVAGIQNVTKGERRMVSVPADQAYGFYDPALVVELRRSELPDGEALEVGAEVKRSMGPRGGQRTLRVIHATRDTLVLDGNHPLAGQDLIFDIEVVSARDAIAADFDDQDEGPAAPASTTPNSRLLH